jgi:hypothetical protein
MLKQIRMSNMKRMSIIVSKTENPPEASSLKHSLYGTNID